MQLKVLKLKDLFIQLAGNIAPHMLSTNVIKPLSVKAYSSFNTL